MATGAPCGPSRTVGEGGLPAVQPGRRPVRQQPRSPAKAKSLVLALSGPSCACLAGSVQAWTRISTWCLRRTLSVKSGSKQLLLSIDKWGKETLSKHHPLQRHHCNLSICQTKTVKRPEIRKTDPCGSLPGSPTSPAAFDVLMACMPASTTNIVQQHPATPPCPPGMFASRPAGPPQEELSSQACLGEAMAPLHGKVCLT